VDCFGFELGGRGSQDNFWIYKRLDQYDRRWFPFCVRWHFEYNRSHRYSLLLAAEGWDHPYGHKKYETLFALGIAAMLLIVAFNLGKAGVVRIINPIVPHVDFICFAVMVITLIINIAVMIYEYRRGKQLQSDILVADSMHTRADISTSFSVIVALVFVKLGIPIVDPVITLVIAGFIAHSAFVIIRQESAILCDAVAITDTKKIEAVVLGIKGVKSCHKIRTRGRLDDVHLDLHIHIDADMTMRDSHLLNHTIQKEIMSVFPQIVDVLVHMEPDSR